MQKRVLGQGALVTLCLILFSCGGGTGTTNSFKQPNPPPSTQIPLSPIQHLIIVVMQNSSFDHLFGTFSGANGLDPNAASYQQVDQAGNTIKPQLLTDLSPPDLNHTRTSYLATYDSGKMDKYAWQNGDTSMDYFDSTSIGRAADGQQFGVGTLWNYAQQYALSDNFFAAAMASEPSNMLYMVSADPGTDPYGYPQLDACTAGLFQQNQSSGATITPPLTTQNVGDQLSANNISWGFYQEYFVNEQNGTCTQYVPQESPFQYFQTTANSANVQNFSISGFNTMLLSGTLPSVMWLQPDPLNSMHPGAGNVANAIEFLDKVVQAVKNSPEWSSTAMVVLWDESGGWYDHVPPPQLNGTLGLGARVPVIVISPYAKANYVSHQQMDFVSILRFIQWNWALGRFADSTQAAREQQSGDLCDLLASSCGSP